MSIESRLRRSLEESKKIDYFVYVVGLAGLVALHACLPVEDRDAQHATIAPVYDEESVLYSDELLSGNEIVEVAQPECAYKEEAIAPSLEGGLFYDFLPEITEYNTIATEIVESHPGIDINDFGIKFGEDLADKINLDTPFVIDTSVNWGKPSQSSIEQVLHNSESHVHAEDDQIISKYMNVIQTLGPALMTLDKFPENIFENAGISELVLRDTEYNQSGSFSLVSKKINYEILDESPDWTYVVYLHELAHALHSVYCAENEAGDNVLKRYNTIPYVGVLADRDWESYHEHYGVIPTELRTYGPKRQFANEYAGTNVYEDFAMTMQWTFVHRGLIQPGDRDYLSPFYFKQLEVVRRIEALLPGTKDYLEKVTPMLRMDPENEIYLDRLAHSLDFEPSTLELLVIKGQLTGDPYVLDATIVMKDEQHPIFQKIIYRPTLQMKEDGTIYLSTGGGTGVILNKDSVNLNVLVPRELIVNGEYTGQVFVPRSELEHDGRIPEGRIIDAKELFFEGHLNDFAGGLGTIKVRVGEGVE